VKAFHYEEPGTPQGRCPHRPVRQAPQGAAMASTLPSHPGGLDQGLVTLQYQPTPSHPETKTR